MIRAEYVPCQRNSTWGGSRLSAFGTAPKALPIDTPLFRPVWPSGKLAGNSCQRAPGSSNAAMEHSEGKELPYWLVTDCDKGLDTPNISMVHKIGRHLQSWGVYCAEGANTQPCPHKRWGPLRFKCMHERIPRQAYFTTE